MKKDFNYITEEFGKISLTPLEQSALRAHLTNFMREHPVQKKILIPSPYQLYGLPSPLNAFSLRSFRFVYATIAVIVLVGGGLTTLAEGSLPGDALYPIKVNVTEEIRAAIALSIKGKASWGATRATRRLEEAEALAADGRLDTPTRIDLETRFAEYADASTKRADESKSLAVKAAVHSNLEATLEAHDQILATMIETNGELTDELSGVLLAVQTRAKTSEDARIVAEEELKAGSDPETEEDAAETEDDSEEKLAKTSELVTELEGSVTADLFADVEARLDASATAHKNGEILFEDGAYGEAFVAFQESLRTAKEAAILLEGSAVLTESTGKDSASTTATTTQATTTDSVATTTAGVATTTSATTSDLLIDIDGTIGNQNDDFGMSTDTHYLPPSFE